MVKWRNARLFELLLVILASITVGALPNKLYITVMFPFLMVYLAIIYIREVFFFYQAYKNIKKSNIASAMNEHPLVSIIIPCYNEGKILQKTISNLSNLNYPNYELIIVNDGSTDNTLSIAAGLINDKIRVLTKPNGGKATALNMGIHSAKGDYVLCVDGDSCIHPDSIQYGLKHFSEPEVAAVAGFVIVKNKNNLLTYMQEFEYLTGLNLPRRAFSNYGIVPIIPGPIGLFRKDVLIKLGGFIEDRRIMAEDAELTFRLITNGYKIKSESNMIAYTEAPVDIISLSKQRYRWNRGIMQALTINFSKMLKTSSLTFLLSIYLFFEIYIVLYVNLAMVISFVTHGLLYGNMLLIDKWFIGLIISKILVVLFIMYNKPNKLKWLLISIISIFTYNMLLIFWRFFSLIDESNNVKMTWNKIERKE